MLLTGIAAGVAAAWLYFRSDRAVLNERLQSRDHQLQQMEALQKETAALKIREAELNAALEQERKAAGEKLAILEDARRKLSDALVVGQFEIPSA